MSNHQAKVDALHRTEGFSFYKCAVCTYHFAMEFPDFGDEGGDEVCPTCYSEDIHFVEDVENPFQALEELERQRVKRSQSIGFEK